MYASKLFCTLCEKRKIANNKMFLKMIVSSLLLILGTLEIVQSLIVRTEDGLIKGKYMKSQCGRKLIGFVGIPYAEPPIGPLRFMVIT